jgi:hypothetical protein
LGRLVFAITIVDVDEAGEEAEETPSQKMPILLIQNNNNNTIENLKHFYLFPL